MVAAVRARQKPGTSPRFPMWEIGIQITWSIFCCFSQDINRVLNSKWRSWDMNQHFAKLPLSSSPSPLDSAQQFCSWRMWLVCPGECSWSFAECFPGVTCNIFPVLVGCYKFVIVYENPMNSFSPENDHVKGVEWNCWPEVLGQEDWVRRKTKWQKIMSGLKAWTMEPVHVLSCPVLVLSLTSCVVLGKLLNLSVLQLSLLFRWVTDSSSLLSRFCKTLAQSWLWM